MLDDPLSAVDAHVGKRIFEECISKHLRGRTVVFVTHQLQYLPACDRVAFMDAGIIQTIQPYEQQTHDIIAPPFQNGARHLDLTCVLHPITFRYWVQNTSRIRFCF